MFFPSANMIVADALENPDPCPLLWITLSVGAWMLLLAYAVAAAMPVAIALPQIDTASRLSALRTAFYATPIRTASVVVLAILHQVEL